MTKQQNNTSIYIDPETRDRLKIQAKQNGRTMASQLRHIFDNNLDLLPPFYRAILLHVAQTHGLDTPLDAIIHLIDDRNHLQRLTLPPDSDAPSLPSLPLS